MNPPFVTRRVTRDNYKSDGASYQSTLKKEDIAKKLEGYARVEANKLYKIPLNTHLRYFVVNPKTGEKQFRLGGYLSKIGDNNEYVVLNNGKVSWSVQHANTIFYKKLTNSEFKEQAITEIEDDIKKKMENLIEENKALKKVIKQIKTTTIKNKENKIKDKDKL